MKSSQKPVSLYIHWPYCLSKCPYCDFASCACPDIDENMLWDGYVRDINQFLSHRPIATVFFGGGTPSLMSVGFFDKILNLIIKKTILLPNCEITIEANPDAITLDKMRDFKSLGANRLSLGIQALNDSDLRFLGRHHDVRTALQRLKEAQTVFDRINMDLIYARPNQTVSDWTKELKSALSLGLSHYSLYQLTIEPETSFGRQGIQSADEKTAVRLYRQTDEIMCDAGVPAYEISNYARIGQECRHNLVYWQGGDYIGIGPAAHGRIGMKATQNPKNVKDWLAKGPLIEILTPLEKETELLLMGLRLRQAWFPDQKLSASKVAALVRQGLLEQSSQGIRPTLDGALVLNQIILELLPDQG